MPKKPIIAFLIVLLSVPLNAGAASSWMALSMSETGTGDALAMAMAHHSADSGQHHSAQQSMHHAGHDAVDSQDSQSSQHSQLSHDHNTEDCDEYCMSCSNHCSSTGIVSVARAWFDPGQLRARTHPGATLSHPKLLFRPPIRL